METNEEKPNDRKYVFKIIGSGRYDKLTEAKRELYSQLLSKDYDSLADNETDILYSLSKDKQIQAILNLKLR